MDVLFIRHATAEPARENGDAARELTDAGREESRNTARALKVIDCVPQTVLTSPLTRARQTAEIVAETCGLNGPKEEEALSPPGNPEALADHVLRLMDEKLDVVAVVGHAPSLDHCLAYLTAAADDIGTSLSKAGAGCVRLRTKKIGLKTQLRWLMHREQLAMLARLA